MAILDTSVTGSLVVDRYDDVFIGLDLPLRKSNGSQGYFESSKTSLAAVKNNVRSLLLTEKNERIMRPTLGLSLKKLIFEPITPGLIEAIRMEIADTFKMWMPFISVERLDVSTTSGGDDGELMGNTIKISLDFRMKDNPRMFETVDVEIGG